MLREIRAAPHLRLAADALGPGDEAPIRLLARGAEGPHQLPLLGRRPGARLPEGRLAAGLPDAQLQPLHLLAGDGVLGECRHPVLQVEGAEVPELAPHGPPVARGRPRKPVDEQHPARSRQEDSQASIPPSRWTASCPRLRSCSAAAAAARPRLHTVTTRAPSATPSPSMARSSDRK